MRSWMHATRRRTRLRFHCVSSVQLATAQAPPMILARLGLVFVEAPQSAAPDGRSAKCASARSDGAAGEDRTHDLSLTKGEAGILAQDQPVSGGRVLELLQQVKAL